MPTTLLVRRAPRSLFDPAAWSDALRARAATPLRVPAQEECEAVANRALALGPSGATTSIYIESEALGTLRWARNRPLASVDRTNLTVYISVRLANGHEGSASTNRLDDASIKTAHETAASMAAADAYAFGEELQRRQEYAKVDMLSTAGLGLDMAARSATGRPMAERCHTRGLLSAGYLAINASARFVKNSSGLTAYHAETRCDYSVTVRDAEGTASGWAGLSHDHWERIDVDALNERAIQKCMDSVNPVAIEPGRYTTILEPEAVGQLMLPAMWYKGTRRMRAEEGKPPYGRPPRGPSKIGLRLFDRRMSVISDPTDPDGQYCPFDDEGTRYRRLVWFENGILRNLWYARGDAARFGDTEALRAPPGPLAFRITGGTTSIADMIKATTRGVLVTHFTELDGVDNSVFTATTRDGFWLIEKGKITKAIRNFRFNESPFFVFNQVLDLGVPERTFGTGPGRGENTIVAPPLRVQDFNFTSLSDAV